MKPYVEMLDRHVAALMEEVRRAKREAGPGTLADDLTDPFLTLFFADRTW